MRSMNLAAILAVLAAAQAPAGHEVVPELMLGGDNQAATVKAGLPVPYDTSTATTTDGVVFVPPGEILDWAVNVTVSGTEGDVNNGAANLVIDLELTRNGSPVDIGGIADGCMGATPSFCSTMNDGTSFETEAGLTPQLASFALSVDARSFATFFGAPADPLPALSGSIIDEVADDGANMDFFTFPSANGYPPEATVPTGALVGMGAGYSSFTPPSDNTTMADGNFAGVGCVGNSPGVTTCGSTFAPNLGSGPFFEGQINTAGLPNGTYTLTVTMQVAGNNVLDGSFDPFGSTGPIDSFAIASTAAGSDSITFDIGGDCFCWPIYAASRKLHGGAVDYDIELFPAPTVSGSNTVGVESRGDGVIDRLVLGFEVPVGPTCNDITIIQGTQTCDYVTDLGNNEYEVALSGGTNNSCLEVELTGLDGSVIRALNIRGDVDGSGGVNIIDLSKVKERIIQGSIDVFDPRKDVDLSGDYNILDLNAVKSSLLAGGSASCP